MAAAVVPADLVIGRYVLYDPIASGGMASVHVGRQTGAVGFARTVAIKRLHRGHATNPEFVSMFVDEARLAARIHHPNVVTTLDVVFDKNEVFLVMEYVQGEPLSSLLRATRKLGERIPLQVVSSVMVGMLQGLHAAHEAKDENGEPLGIVHRDISPQNVIVGVDGGSRLLDFGVAKANVRLTSTGAGQLKGKLAYMAPEQFAEDRVSRASDIYACGVVLWELLVARPVFADVANQAALVGRILNGEIPRLHGQLEGVPDALCDVIAKAHARSPSERFATARDLALAVEAVVPPASAFTVAAWVQRLAGEELEKRAGLVAEIEQRSNRAPAVATGPAISRFRIEDEPTASQQPTLTFVRSSLDAPALSIEPVSGSSKADEASPAPERSPPPVPELAAPERKRPWLIAGLALAALASTVLVVVSVSSDRSRAGSGTASGGSAMTATSAGASEPPSSSAAPASSARAVQSEIVASATESTDALLASSARLATVTHGHGVVGSAKPSTHAGTPACLPPYTLVPMFDESGAPVMNKNGTQKTMKRPKPHCLQTE